MIKRRKKRDGRTIEASVYRKIHSHRTSIFLHPFLLLFFFFLFWKERRFFLARTTEIDQTCMSWPTCDYIFERKEVTLFFVFYLLSTTRADFSFGYGHARPRFQNRPIFLYFLVSFFLRTIFRISLLFFYLSISTLVDPSLALTQLRTLCPIFRYFSFFFSLFSFSFFCSRSPSFSILLCAKAEISTDLFSTRVSPRPGALYLFWLESNFEFREVPRAYLEWFNDSYEIVFLFLLFFFFFLYSKGLSIRMIFTILYSANQRDRKCVGVFLPKRGLRPNSIDTINMRAHVSFAPNRSSGTERDATVTRMRDPEINDNMRCITR